MRLIGSFVAGVLMCAAIPVAAQDADIAYAEKKITPAERKCDDPVMNFPRWAGYPVQLCEYTDDEVGATVKTHMLNADRTKIARWLVTACRETKAKIRPCIDFLVGEITTAASFNVFPVSGYIPEPDGGNICYVFRDGVTVWTQKRPVWQKVQNKSCGPFVEGDEPLHTVWAYGRIASTTRKDYTKAGGTRPVDGLNWIDVVRELYQAAWNSDRNELISAKAIAKYGKK